MLWDQLQQGPRPPNLVTTQPRGPHVNGRLLCPPPAWLKQRDSGATTTSAKSDTNSVQNLSENSNLVTSQQSTKVGVLNCYHGLHGSAAPCKWLPGFPIGNGEIRPLTE